MHERLLERIAFVKATELEISATSPVSQIQQLPEHPLYAYNSALSKFHKTRKCCKRQKAVAEF